MVAANHPLGAAAGFEMLAAGGNAVDAAVATLLALTVVEPMMVGVAGGGLAHVRGPDGGHVVFDCMSAAPASAPPDAFTPTAPQDPLCFDVQGRRNQIGGAAIATPGNLWGWDAMHRRFGRLPFADVIAPAIRLAERGFAITHYLAGAIREAEADLARDPAMAAVMRPGGRPLAPGERLTQGAYAQTLRVIAGEGAAALHGGAVGDALAARAAQDGGWLTADDLRAYRTEERAPVFSPYRDCVVAGPPPPASAGVHIAQMLNIVAGDDLAGLGFGAPETTHLIVEAMRCAFADRRRHGGEPDAETARLTAKDYGAALRAGIGPRAAPRADRQAPGESADTTHVTVADRDGCIVTATHTINGIFGARIMEPETGVIPNNYMMNFDPRPGRAQSIAPDRRVPTSMAPMIVLRGGAPFAALGLPGGLRIFPSAFQAIVNLVDHGMTAQQAVEAPRVWCQGGEVEIEKAHGAAAAEALRARGHDVRVVPHVGGGMNAILFGADGLMTGAACWRADGVVAALGGGLARPGVRFWPDAAPDEDADETQGKGIPS